MSIQREAAEAEAPRGAPVQHAAVAGAPPGRLTPERVLALQRTAGNATVGRLLQRRIEAGDLPKKKPSEVMRDETYMDNEMVRLQFFGAEAATIHYKDGSKLSLGLVPEHVKEPFEAVDYRTTSHASVVPEEAGKLTFIPRGRDAALRLPDTAKMGDLLQFARDVKFKHDPTSGRIVPTEVNSLTAPRLCEALRDAEVEYVKDFDAFAKGGEKVMKKLELIVILASLLGGGGGKPKPSGGAAGAAATASAKAESKLLGFLKGLLKRGGGKGAQIAVEGVDIAGVEVAIQGERLIVRYSHIINTGRVAGSGRMVQSALERAAITAAKESGAKFAEVGVTTIVNPRWQAYLESLGYVPEMVQVAQTHWTKVWMRVFTL